MGTSIAAIRDRLTTVLRQATPNVSSSDKFVPFAEDLAGDFETWAEANPGGATRQFQVRDASTGASPDHSQVEFEERFAPLVIEVAYPQSNRWGSDGALGRDDVIESDRLQIEKVVGLYGKANFTPPFPDACFRPDRYSYSTVRKTACDFLVVLMTFSYYRSV